MEIKNMIKDEADYALYGCALEGDYFILKNYIEVGLAKRSFIQWDAGFATLGMPNVFRKYFVYYKYNTEERWKL